MGAAQTQPTDYRANHYISHNVYYVNASRTHLQLPRNQSAPPGQLWAPPNGTPGLSPRELHF